MDQCPFLGTDFSLEIFFWIPLWWGKFFSKLIKYFPCKIYWKCWERRMVSHNWQCAILVEFNRIFTTCINQTRIYTIFCFCSKANRAEFFKLVTLNPEISIHQFCLKCFTWELVGNETDGYLNNSQHTNNFLLTCQLLRS